MKRNGNLKVNRTYNPQNAKPPIPLDVDDVDAVLERFIRQKYDQQTYMSGSTRPARKNDSGSTRSSDDQPPPLPPKPARRFGFGLRSASSALPLHFNGPSSPPRSPPTRNGWDDEPLKVNKQSRVFGATVGGSNDNIDNKLLQLREMGFTDEKRNANVLKGLGGNLEKTIEQLVRLGEGSAPASRSRTPVQPKGGVASQQAPPLTSATATTNGLSFTSNNAVSRTDTTSNGQQGSQIPEVPSQQIPSRTLSPSNPYHTPPLTTTSNPPSANPVTSIDQAFSNMQISQQPLFPNATGGYPNQPPHIQDARLQTMTPPVPQALYTQTNPFMQQNAVSNSHVHPFYQPLQQPNGNYNQLHQSFQPQINGTSYNPFLQNSAASSPRIPYSTDSPQPYSPQQGTFEQPSASQQQVDQNQNVYMSQPSLTHPPAPANLQGQNAPLAWNPFRQQQLQPQQTGRLDKTSILALYNYPQFVPSPLSMDGSQEVNGLEAPSHANGVPATAPQRSVTMPVKPVTGSKNPFQSSLSLQPNPTMNPPGIGRHVSQESVDIGGFQNGRHSPDAFANLSARHV